MTKGPLTVCRLPGYQLQPSPRCDMPSPRGINNRTRDGMEIFCWLLKSAGNNDWRHVEDNKKKPEGFSRPRAKSRHILISQDIWVPSILRKMDHHEKRKRCNLYQRVQEGKFRLDQKHKSGNDGESQLLSIVMIKNMEQLHQYIYTQRLGFNCYDSILLRI